MITSELKNESLLKSPKCEKHAFKCINPTSEWRPIGSSDASSQIRWRPVVRSDRSLCKRHNGFDNNRPSVKTTDVSSSNSNDRPTRRGSMSDRSLKESYIIEGIELLK